MPRARPARLHFAPAAPAALQAARERWEVALAHLQAAMDARTERQAPGVMLESIEARDAFTEYWALRRQAGLPIWEP